MSLTDLIADQHRLPRGPLAPWAARSLNRRNDSLIRSCIEALTVEPTDSVLDVGFGGALSLRILLRELHLGKVSGVEPSVPMVRRAGRLLLAEVKAGRLVLRVGTVDAIPFASGTFDGILTCQTIYFWSDVHAGAAELFRVLAPGGRCVVAMMPRRLQEHLGFVERGYNVVGHQELARQLNAAGFISISPSAPPSAGGRCLIMAHKPAATALPVVFRVDPTGASTNRVPNGRHPNMVEPA